MLGHDMSWASFNVIEVMSQERFALKRVGFLAASQSFNAKTDVLVLCTQLLKREFQAKSPYEIGLGVNCLANSGSPISRRRPSISPTSRAAAAAACCSCDRGARA